MREYKQILTIFVLLMLTGHRAVEGSKKYNSCFTLEVNSKYSDMFILDILQIFLYRTVISFHLLWPLKICLPLTLVFLCSIVFKLWKFLFIQYSKTLHVNVFVYSYSSVIGFKDFCIWSLNTSVKEELLRNVQAGLVIVTPSKSHSVECHCLCSFAPFSSQTIYQGSCSTFYS